MISNHTVLNKWNNENKKIELKIKPIKLNIDCDIYLLPRSWDSRKRKSKMQEKILLPKVEEGKSDYVPTKLKSRLKSFEGTLLHELYLNLPLDKTMNVKSKIINEREKSTSVQNRFKERNYFENQEIYISPFLIEQTNSMMDHITLLSLEKEICIIPYEEYIRLVNLSFIEMFEGRVVRLSGFILSGCSHIFTSAINEFIFKVQNQFSELNDIAQNLFSSLDNYWNILGQELYFFLQSSHNYFWSQNTYKYIESDIFKYCSQWQKEYELSNCKSISQLQSIVQNYQFILVKIEHLVNCLKSSIDFCSYDANVKSLNFFAQCVKIEWLKQLKDRISNFEDISSVVVSDKDHMILRNKSLRDIFTISSINDLQKWIQAFRQLRVNARNEIDRSVILGKEELLFLMTPKEMFSINEESVPEFVPPSVQKIELLPTDNNVETDDFSKALYKEKEILKWRRSRLLNNNDKVESSDIHQPHSKEIQDTTYEQMDLDSDQVSNTEFEPVQTEVYLNDMEKVKCPELLINSTAEDFQIITLRDLYLFLDAVINKRLGHFFEVIFFFYPTDFHSNFEIITTKIPETFNDLEFNYDVNFIDFKFLRKLLIDYYKLRSGMNVHGNPFPIRSPKKYFESMTILGVKICLDPVFRFLNIEFLQEIIEWNLYLPDSKLYTKLFQEIFDLVTNKLKVFIEQVDLLNQNVHNLDRILDLIPNLSPAPSRHNFGSKEWWEAWEIWVKLNQYQ
eukprot:NODE_20_length_44879_cov_0.624654.p6 type:complete len:735 gc:universal NODE_20_length_44879_cov_0.624654:3625-5829(+)